ncbi:hypothetical protein [Actinacidiphila acididurans]|uniref:Uncharacterized protein n=1 Tax=Actinacidiphila acididurans TaxID=2784346 RepID=A0ABS2TTL6_9ACTN|nr:hypothetical protein [Actinacidiphila acididurans]MBM9506685.1 hypothetical protein [Actinacidiphila acididurans]
MSVVIGEREARAVAPRAVTVRGTADEPFVRHRLVEVRFADAYGWRWSLVGPRPRREGAAARTRLSAGGPGRLRGPVDGELGVSAALPGAETADGRGELTVRRDRLNG